MIDANHLSNPLQRLQSTERPAQAAPAAAVKSEAAVAETTVTDTTVTDTRIASSVSATPSALTAVSLVETAAAFDGQGIVFGTPQDRHEQAAHTWAQTMMDRPRHEIKMMRDFLTAHQNTPLARIPQDQRNFLDAIPAEMRTQLPLLAQQLSAQDNALELRLYAQRHPEQVNEALDGIRTLMRAGVMDPAERAGYVQTQLAQLSSEARQIISSLGLDQQLEQLTALHEALTDLRMDLHQMHSIERLERVSPALSNVSLGEGMTVTPRSEAELAAQARIQQERILQQQSDVLINMTVRNVNHAAEFNEISGLEGFMLKAKELSPGAEKVIAQILAIRDAIQTGDTDRVTALKAELDITNGHDAVIMMMLSNASNLTDTEQLPALIAQIQNGGTAGLGQNEKDLLRKFGLGVDPETQQLVNLVNGSEIRPEELPQLKALAEYNRTSLSSMEVRDYALNSAAALVEDFATKTGLITDLQATMTTRAEQMDGVRRRQESNTQAITAQTTVVDRLKIQVEDATQQVTVLTTAIRPFEHPSGGIVIPPNASRYDIGNLNQALKPLGLSVDTSNGQVRFQFQGRAISESAFVTRVEQGLGALHTRLDGFTRQLEEARQKLTQLRTEGAAIDAELASLESAQHQDLGKFRELIGSLDLEGMEAKRNDPNFWNGLSDQHKQLFEQALATARQQKKMAPQFESRITEGLNKVAASRKAYHQADTKAAHSLNQSEQTLKQAYEAGAAAKAQQTQLQQQAAKLQAQLAEESAALAAKADKLENTLNLVPRPVTISVGVLVREWIDTLSSYQDLAHKAQMQTLADQTIARTHAQQQQERLKENISYHLKQLQQLDGRQEARVEQALRESLATTAQGVQAILASVKPTEQ